MSRHISPEYFIDLPSGNRVHPCRLIHKDGTIMWQDAIWSDPPETQAQEQHIIKTAQRIEELNSWVSQGLEPWECLVPLHWYVPQHPVLGDGISLYFEHAVLNTADVYETLKTHVLEHESLKWADDVLFFSRC